MANKHKHDVTIQLAVNVIMSDDLYSRVQDDDAALLKYTLNNVFRNQDRTVKNVKLTKEK